MQTSRSAGPDLAALRAFVAVAREGGVSRAAERLHLSQPAVSLQLKALGQQLGLLLFRRTPQGLVLTRDGAALLPLADRALAAVRDVGQAAERLQATVRGTLRIGTILDPGFTRLGAFLKELVEAAPQIATELRQSMSGDVLAQLVAGTLDVGYGLADPSTLAEPAAAGAPLVEGDQALPLPRNSLRNIHQAEGVKAHSASLVIAKELQARALTRFSYRVVAPAGWGPQVQGRGWSALAALPWLDTPPASAHNRLLARVFGPGSLTGIEPQRVALVDQESSMLDLVKSGVGLSLLRDSTAIREAQAGGLVVADQVALDCVLVFACHRNRAAEPVVANAWNAVERVWG
jgi:DNA-binding transcriptional LysR family regulator